MSGQNDAQTVVAHLNLVTKRIHEACKQHDRAPADVRLLAVSKTKPPSAVAAAMAAGQQHFGENYLQDALPKIEALPDAIWHFIGHIQSNKTRVIANQFDWVHTVSSTKVARRLSEQRDPDRGPLKALIQVNISHEENKSGVSAAEAGPLAAFCATCENLDPVGLMAIPAKSEGTKEQRLVFRQLADLCSEISTNQSLPRFTELSMGMSGDLEAAIAEGATWVRIGTDIFGAREAVYTPASEQ